MKYVYVISAADGRTKVGITGGSCAKRAAAITSTFKQKVVLKYWVRLHRARRIEVAAHYLLRQNRERHEWFTVDADVAIAVIRHAINRLKKCDDRIWEGATTLRSETLRRRYTNNPPTENEMIQAGLEIHAWRQRR